MISRKQILGGLFAVQLLLSPTLAAAATVPSLLAPMNSFVYIEANTANPNPLPGQLKTWLEEAALDAENPGALNVIAENLDKTNIGISYSMHQQDGSEITFLSMTLPADDFEAMLNDFTSDELSINNLGQNKIIYQTGPDFYFAYLDGNLIASNKEGVISDHLLVQNADSVSKTADWQYLNKHSSGQEFLRALINFNYAPADAYSDNTIGAAITDLVVSEGFSLEEKNDGIKALITVKPGKLLTAFTDKLTFTPDLYKKVNPKGVLLYSESYNWAENLEQTMQSLSNLGTYAETDNMVDLYGELKTALLTYTSLDLDQDLAPLFQQRSALLISDESSLQPAPAFTLLSEVKGQETKASLALGRMDTTLEKSLTDGFNTAYDEEISYREILSEYYDDETMTSTPLPAKEALMSKFFFKSTKTVNGTQFRQWNINPNANSYFYTEDYTSTDKDFIVLSTGVTPDGLLIVTTSKNLEQLLSTSGGLANDSEWKKSFQGNSTLSLFFINFRNVQTYINTMAKEAGATEEELKPMNDILTPLHSFMSSSTYDKTDAIYLGQLDLKMDVSSLDALGQNLSDLFSGFSEMNSDYYWDELPYLDLSAPALFQPYHFTDVNADDWYAGYTYHMANLNIMKGYDDGSFRPGQSITRAEYVKTIITAYSKLYDVEIPLNVVPLEGFSDVHTGDWYAPYINYAKNLEIVNGYNDGSFKPNQPISRAEAVSILIRLWGMESEYSTMDSDLPFTDVSPTDWFYGNVLTAYRLELIKGKTATTFAPASHLSRAETATIVSRYVADI